MLPLVVTVESLNGQTRRYAFADSPVRVGRSPFAELQLTEAFVSRWEGTLRFDESEVTYFHVSSTNPTYVDGRVAGVHEEVSIGTSTVLTLGELKLRFAREPVREEDLRRKGKRRPIKADDESVAKTMWLDASRPIEPPGAHDPQVPDSAVRASIPDSVRPYASESVRPPPPASARPESARPQASGSVRIAREVRVLPAQAIVTPAHGNARSDLPVASSLPGVSEHVQALVRPPGGFTTPLSERPSASPPPLPEQVAWDSRSSQPPRAQPDDLDGLHTDYRAAWGELLVALSLKLDQTPEAQRAEVAEQFQRRYLQITQEPEFRSLLKRYKLDARKPDIAEIGEWLRNIAQGVLPPKFRLDTGLTLERVLSLLEMLTQSFAEINDAQDNIRRHWLGRAPRSSLLRSDNGRVILAYLLNPKADWGERLGELESAISDVVMHELSLFKATLEGARSLLDSLSPAALAKAEGIDLEGLEEGASGGFLGRLLPRDSPEARLWRRFATTYEGLMDGDRYQRLFLGRQFARTYLAAMGQRDNSEERDKERAEREKERTERDKSR